MKLEGIYNNQGGLFIDNSNPNKPMTMNNSNFWLANITIGYRLPKRYGKLSLSVLNLFDQDFNFQDTNISSPLILPERSIFGYLTLAF